MQNCYNRNISTLRGCNFCAIRKITQATEVSSALPAVIGNVDCEREKDLSIRIDELLIASGIEARFVKESIVQWK